MAQRGKGVLVKVNTGTEALPTWTKVAGQQGGSLSRSVDTIDATTKDSDTKEFLVGHEEWSIEADGLLQLNDEGFARLEEAFSNKEFVQVQFASQGFTYTGMALITDLPLEAGHEDLVTWSVTFQGSGALTRTTN